MIIRSLITAAFLALATPAMASMAMAQDNPWEQRDNDLVEMAGLLGELHYYHQVCNPGDRVPALYRIRMMEMVSLEEPHQDLKDRMIEAFNGGYQSTKAQFDRCSAQADSNMRRIAAEGNDVATRLGAPFRQVEDYDYEAGGEVTYENGVAVYRSGD